MPQLFPKEVFQECPENLPTCCHMGSAYGPPERSYKRSTLREIPVCESQPQDIIRHLWCILGSTASSPSKHASGPANFVAHLLCVREPALGDKRLPGLQELGSPWGNKARTLKHLVSKVRYRIYRERPFGGLRLWEDERQKWAPGAPGRLASWLQTVISRSSSFSRPLWLPPNTSQSTRQGHSLEPEGHKCVNFSIYRKSSGVEKEAGPGAQEP